MEIKLNRKIKALIVYIVLIVLTLIWWLPLIWSIIVSFKPVGSRLSDPVTWFVKPFTLDNYWYVITNSQSDIPLWMTNSLITASISTIIILFLSSLAGYAFSCFNFPGRKVWFWLIMSGMMIPIQSLLIPMYLLFRKLEMLNTYWALILPALGSSFGVILMKQFIDRLPRALFESARMDGCNSGQIFLYMVLPLIKPALGSLSIFIFLQQWNDFLWPYISITKQKIMTIPIGIVLFKSQSEMDKGFALAGNVLAIMPVLIAFLFFQKSIVKGVTLSGLKE